MDPVFWPGQLFAQGETVYSTTLYENDTPGEIRELVVTDNGDGSFSSYVYSWNWGNTELYADDFSDDRSAFTETRDWLEAAGWTRVV